MAATGLPKAVTSALELLAGYSYQPSDAHKDPAYRPLQSLGLADELILERNQLRAKLAQVSSELITEKENSRLQAAHLQTLIDRVKGLPQAEQVLAGIPSPQPLAANRTLVELLGEYSALLKETKTGLIDPAETGEVTRINAYLDKILVKSETSLELLERLELSKETLIAPAWKRVKANLSEKLQRPHSVLDEITLKIKALNALKSVEVSSLEEAWKNAGLIRSKLEDFIVESEGWVVIEANHKRVEMSEMLKETILRRLKLLAAPWTVENLKELGDIYSDYEYVRKTAVLQPWGDRVQVECEWWNLVPLCSQLSRKSQETLQLLSYDNSLDLNRTVDALQGQAQVDNQGVFNFLDAMIKLLGQAEDIKYRLLASPNSESPVTKLENADIVRVFGQDFLALSHKISTWAEQPTSEIGQLSDLLSQGKDIGLLLPRLVETAENLKKTAVVKIDEKIGLHWAEKLLVKCAGFYPEGDNRKRLITQEISALRQDMQGQYLERRESIVNFIHDSFDYLQKTITDLHTQGSAEKQSYSPSTATEYLVTRGQLTKLQSEVDAGFQELETVLGELQGHSQVQIKAWAENMQQDAKKTAEPSARLQLLVDSFKGLAGQMSYLTPTPKSPTSTPTPKHVLTVLETDLNLLIKNSMSLLETAGKPALLTQGTTLLQTSFDQITPLPAFKAKFDYVNSACFEVKTMLKSETAAEDLPLVRKLKDVIDQMHRNALDLAKGSNSPANEQMTRKKVQDQASVLAKNPTLMRLGELLGEAVALERQQVDQRFSEDFTMVESCEVEATSKGPVAGDTSPPTNIDKLTTGLRYLLQTTKKIETLLCIPIDETQSAQKLAQIEVNTGYQRLLLEEAFLHWRLGNINEMAEKQLKQVTSSVLSVLEKRIQAMPAGQPATDLQVAMENIRKNERTTAPFSQVSSAVSLLDTAVPKAGFKVNAMQGVLEAVENLGKVYDEELAKHSVDLEASSEEMEQMTGGNSQARASAMLATMERGLRRLSGLVPPKETFVSSIQTILSQVVLILSRTDAEKLDHTTYVNQIEQLQLTVETLKSRSEKIYSRLRKINSPTEHQDICAHIEMLIAFIRLNREPEVAIKETKDEDSLSPDRTPLSGFPPRYSPYAPIDKAANETLGSVVAVYETVGLTDLAQEGRNQIAVTCNMGDQQGILINKLNFMKDSLKALKINYEKLTYRPLAGVLDQNKRHVITLTRLLKDESEEEKVLEELRQAQLKESNGDLKASLQLMESVLARVVTQLAQRYEAEYQGATEESGRSVTAQPGKKLSASPTRSNIGMEKLREIANSLETLCDITTPPHITSKIKSLETISGLEKLQVEENIVEWQLGAVLSALNTYIGEVVPVVSRSLRAVSNGLPNRVDIEMGLIDISGRDVTLQCLRDLIVALDDQIATLTSP